MIEISTDMHMTGKIFKRTKRGDPKKEGTAETHKMGLKEGMNPHDGVTIYNAVENLSRVTKAPSKQKVDVPELNIPEKNKFQVFKRGKPFTRMATNK